MSDINDKELKHKAKVLNKIMPLIQMCPVINQITEDTVKKVNAIIELDRDKRNSEIELLSR